MAFHDVIQHSMTLRCHGNCVSKNNPQNVTNVTNGCARLMEGKGVIDHVFRGGGRCDLTTFIYSDCLNTLDANRLREFTEYPTIITNVPSIGRFLFDLNLSFGDIF